MQDAGVGDGDVISVDDVASAGTESAEGAKGLSCCATATTDGLGEECGCIDSGSGDVTGVGDLDSATGGIADEGAAKDDGITDGETSNTTTTTHGLGEQTDGIVTGGLNQAGACDLYGTSVGGSGATGTHEDVACDFSGGTTTTTDGLGEQCGRAEPFADEAFSGVAYGDITTIGKSANKVGGTEVETGANVTGTAATATDGLHIDERAEVAGSLNRAGVGERNLACTLASGAIAASELSGSVDLTGVTTTTTNGLEADTW